MREYDAGGARQISCEGDQATCDDKLRVMAWQNSKDEPKAQKVTK
jgi:hypothetical protein